MCVCAYVWSTCVCIIYMHTNQDVHGEGQGGGLLGLPIGGAHFANIVHTCMPLGDNKWSDGTPPAGGVEGLPPRPQQHPSSQGVRQVYTSRGY